MFKFILTRLVVYYIIKFILKRLLVYYKSDVTEL